MTETTTAAPFLLGTDAVRAACARPDRSELWTDLAGLGAKIAAEVDRLWPEETDPAYRGACLAEEAGEVSRAITKRRHAQHAADGRCKGLTVAEWDEELAVELAQLVGVALDIAEREGIDLGRRLVDVLWTLERRQAGS